jgi:hypothetical protein
LVDVKSYVHNFGLHSSIFNIQTTLNSKCLLIVSGYRTRIWFPAGIRSLLFASASSQTYIASCHLSSVYWVSFSLGKVSRHEADHLVSKSKMHEILPSHLDVVFKCVEHLIIYLWCLCWKMKPFYKEKHMPNSPKEMK